MGPLKTKLRDGTETWTIPSDIKYFPSHHNRVTDNISAEDLKLEIADEEWLLADLDNRMPHREDGPAISQKTYTTDHNQVYFAYWFLNGKLNSINDKPAKIIYEEESSSEQMWAKDNLIHRINGSAYVMRVSGESKPFREAWYTFNEMHRLDGPALIIDPLNMNDQEYFLHGKNMDIKEFESITTNRTPIQIALEMIKQNKSYDYIIKHAIASLKYYEADPDLIEQIEIGLML